MNKKQTSYGLKELQLFPVVEDILGGETEYGASVRCYAAQEASFTIEMSEVSVRGDDQVIEYASNVSNVSWSIKNGYIQLDQLKVLLGGRIDEILDDEGKPKGEQFTLQAGSSLPYFALVGKTLNGGNTTKALIYKAIATGGITINFADENYAVIEVSGQAVGRNSDNNIYNMKLLNGNEAITAADLVAPE